jgi:mannitol-specific phosphotransferase system IIBC component
MKGRVVTSQVSNKNYYARAIRSFYSTLKMEIVSFKEQFLGVFLLWSVISAWLNKLVSGDRIILIKGEMYKKKKKKLKNKKKKKKKNKKKKKKKKKKKTREVHVQNKSHNNYMNLKVT